MDLSSENNILIPPVVVNKYKVNMNDPDIVYIGRGSKWGNKSPMSSSRSREQVIQDYRLQLSSQLKSGEITSEDILSLSGKRLACFCKPQDCHGDIIVNSFNWILNKSIKHP